MMLLQGVHRLRRVALGLFLVLATEWVFAQAICPPDGGPYMGGRDPAKTSVVVFIHGVLSNALDAWGTKTTAWPCLLRDEPVFKSSNIYLYNYETHLLGSDPSIDKVAAQLVRDLQLHNVLDHAHITVIAHSMGGLVLSAALLAMDRDESSRPHLERIKLVNFFGTPGDGASIASIAALFSENPQFGAMQPGENEAKLQQWQATKWPFTSYCFAEGKRTGFRWLVGTQVVTPESAWALCKDRPKSLELLERFDHITMVKPDSVRAPPHRALYRNFAGCVAAKMEELDLPSEVDSAEGQLLLRLLSDLRERLSDFSVEGRKALQPAAQAVLYSPGWQQQYLFPKSIGSSQLIDSEYDRLNGRVFANEFVKFVESHAARLEARWIVKMERVESRVKDGRMIELRKRWRDAGVLAANDYAIALDFPDVSGQLLLIGTVVRGAQGEAQAFLRGMLYVPPPPRSCP